jgi:hypothetical protein
VTPKSPCIINKLRLEFFPNLWTNLKRLFFPRCTPLQSIRNKTKHRNSLRITTNTISKMSPFMSVFSRWRLCVSDVDNVLGFALGAMFVNRTFDGHSKPEAEAMIKVCHLVPSRLVPELPTHRRFNSQTIQSPVFAHSWAVSTEI